MRWLDVGNNTGLRFLLRQNHELFLTEVVRSRCALTSSTHCKYGHRQQRGHANRDLEWSLRPIHRSEFRKSAFRECTAPLDELGGAQSSPHYIPKHRLSLAFLQAVVTAGPLRFREECLPN